MNQASPTAVRADLYAPIHKALRSQMCHTLCRVGDMDVHDAADLQAGLAQLDELLTACLSHLKHEKDFVHAAINARQPGGAHLHRRRASGA